MRISFVGLLVQFAPGNEGYKLKRLGLITLRDTPFGADMEPTAELLGMWDGKLDLEAAFPVLSRYAIGYTPTANMFDAEADLIALGMTEAGLKRLSVLAKREFDLRLEYPF